MGFIKIQSLKDLFSKKEVYSYSCETISIYNFNKARTARDLRWLNVGYSGFGKAKEPKNGSELFKEILFEYCDIINDRKSKDYYNQLAEVYDLNTDYIYCERLVDLLFKSTSLKVFEQIKAELSFRGIYVGNKIDVLSNPYKVEKLLKQRKTRLLREKSLLDDMESTGSEPVSIERQKIMILKALDLKTLNLKETSAKEFAEMVNMVNEKANKQAA